MSPELQQSKQFNLVKFSRDALRVLQGAGFTTNFCTSHDGKTIHVRFFPDGVGVCSVYRVGCAQSFAGSTGRAYFKFRAQGKRALFSPPDDCVCLVLVLSWPITNTLSIFLCQYVLADKCVARGMGLYMCVRDMRDIYASGYESLHVVRSSERSSSRLTVSLWVFSEAQETHKGCRVSQAQFPDGEKVFSPRPHEVVRI